MRVSREKYIRCLIKNKSEYPACDRWRVEEKEHDKYYIIKGNTFALDKDKTISGISKTHISTLKGKDILRKAIKKGGNKLQAFGEKLYNFYTENGFIPVCIIKFDMNYAPKGCTQKDNLILYYYKGSKQSTPYRQALKILPKYKTLDQGIEYRKIIMGEV